MSSKVIGVDIGGTNLRIGEVDEEGKLSAFQKLPIGRICDSDSVPDALCGFLRSYLAENHPEEVKAAALGFPATMDKQRTRVLSAPNLKGIDNTDIRAMIADALGIPVFLEKDVAMLFFCDAEKFRLPPEGIVIGCYIGTGIGNVISIDGKLLKGSSGAACELGHIPVPGGSLVCGCGNTGCMETIASGKALERIVGKRPIAEAFCELNREIRQFVDAAACAVASEINILDPDAVLLGGGVLAMKNFPTALLEERIRFHTRKPLPADNLKFFYSEDNGQNGVLGAAVYARKCLKEGR